jgi:hypothetical protein
MIPADSISVYSSITPEVIAEAAAAGITGVKVYPQGESTLGQFLDSPMRLPRLSLSTNEECSLFFDHLCRRDYKLRLGRYYL